jgi:hypothetical protein
MFHDENKSLFTYAVVKISFELALSLILRSTSTKPREKLSW